MICVVAVMATSSVATAGAAETYSTISKAPPVVGSIPGGNHGSGEGKNPQNTGPGSGLQQARDSGVRRPLRGAVRIRTRAARKVQEPSAQKTRGLRAAYCQRPAQGG